MSDYFGALMNLSGLGEQGRAPIAPAHAAQAGGDIAESETVREAVAPAAQPRVPEPGLPIANSAALERAAAGIAESLPLPADAMAEPQPAPRAATQPMTALTPAAAVAAPMAAEPHHAVVRAALEWVADDPHNVADRRGIAKEQEIIAPHAPAAATTTRMSQPGTAVSARVQPARPAIEEVEIVGIGAAPRMQVAQHGPAADRETEATRTRAQQNVAPAARIVAGEAAASGRAAPAIVADETVEISIGAISVRVDAPVLQASAAPPTPARVASERPAAVSALSRRALRRF